MQPAEICARRLAAQHLTRPARETPVDVVRALGAVQAQDYPGAKWALGQRVAGATDAAIESLFNSGALIRTHVLRPTWHFVAPEDLRWMLTLTAPRIATAMRSYNRKLGLTPEVLGRSQEIMARALEGGRHLTRAELKQAMERAGIPLAPQPLGHVVMHAELEQVICSGPRRGGQFTYALLAERVPPTPARDRDEALLDLTLRYFRTRGPATAADFGWWSGLSMADAKRGIDIAGPALRRLEIDGRPYWLSPSPRAPRLRARAHLLPNYDEYFIGLKDRGAIGRRVGGSTLVTGGDALTAHVAFVGGQLVGGWRRTQDPDAVVVNFQPVTRLSRAERAMLEQEVRRLSRFLAMPAVLRDRNAKRR